ncbi:hypothetical protein CLOM_g7697 [Closterium sp. NIES-68]|nr:hypothetical protein CLOM_g7697 [Closterium sp. NIES-68]GJP61872.1 hypothetical protein CLOP_g18991 [Closterium sp. NIES-67]
MSAPPPPGVRVLPVDVWSDIACPWCYVGKARLDAAIAAVEASPVNGQAVAVQVTWHAYMIDMRTKRQGEPYLAYNQRRWGGDGWTTSLRRSGARSGLKFADWQWWPNTLHAHRLVHAATKHGKGSEAKQRLFEMTYEEGRNVSDARELAAAATALGLTHIDSAAYFESEEGQQEVLEDDAYGKKELNITGVPFFIVNKKYSIAGCQETAAFKQVFEKALAN